MKLVLRHETLHLRIGEYVAAKAKANMPEFTAKVTVVGAVKATAAADAKRNALKEVSDKFAAFQQKWLDVEVVIQTRYDDETKNSNDPGKQADWEAKYDKFADEELKKIGWAK